MSDSVAQKTTSNEQAPPPATTILTEGQWCDLPKKVLLERIAKANITSYIG
jgi:hypothetical protein